MFSSNPPSYVSRSRLIFPALLAWVTGTALQLQLEQLERQEKQVQQDLLELQEVYSEQLQLLSPLNSFFIA